MWGKLSQREGDVVVVDAGQVIPGDGEIIEGVASIDESAITGASKKTWPGCGKRTRWRRRVRCLLTP
jgi:high-affinity K+ transport system ATPase subunit B